MQFHPESVLTVGGDTMVATFLARCGSAPRRRRRVASALNRYGAGVGVGGTGVGVGGTGVGVGGTGVGVGGTGVGVGSGSSPTMIVTSAPAPTSTPPAGTWRMTSPGVWVAGSSMTA